MENKQQTAVEWLLLRINIAGVTQGTGLSVDEIIEQAKEMEKQQIKDAVMITVTTFPPIRKIFEEQFDQYYNETYGK